jgi:4-hydroxy-2-oxoglutarate aldolase
MRVFDAARAGRHAEARDLQQQLMPLARLVTTVHGVPGLKAAMDACGYVGGEPRPPLVPIGAEALAQIRAELARVQEAV